MDAFKVRDWRKAKGFTQQELADRAGIAQESVARYETAGITPHLANARKLADALGISVFELRQLPCVAYGLASIAEEQSMATLAKPMLGLSAHPSL